MRVDGAAADGLHETPAAVELQRSYAASVSAHTRALSDVELVVSAFDAAGLTPRVIKGPVLAEAVYRRPDLRSYVDLDVLVKPDEFESGLHALERAGARIHERNWSLVRDRELGELRLITPSAGAIDLHRHLFNDPRARAEFPVDLVAVHERLRPVRLGGIVVQTLDPVDTVVHLALHACLAGA
ncbi:MAG: nucleotidyltransferase family protein, partial [Mycobacterium sp.]|nr:nucleotidyltransferase family protein [Mycobacterium sp.]